MVILISQWTMEGDYVTLLPYLIKGNVIQSRILLGELVVANDVHAKASNKEWQDMLWEYLRKELKMCVDFKKMNRQWETFLKKGMTAKGMYFCLKYFYDIKKGDPTKSENGIGIIPYVYEESKEYWYTRERQQKGICAKLEEQIRQTHRQNKIIVRQTQTKTTRRANYNLEDIENMEE